MSLGYKRITEEQDQLRNVFPKGEYKFLVESVEEKTCKNGINKMLVVGLLLLNEGRSLKITDWIMLDMENFEYKLRHFAETCGLLDKYDLDNLEATDFLGREGVAKVSVSEYEKDGEIIKTNRINDYAKQNLTKSNDSEFANSDIPF